MTQFSAYLTTEVVEDYSDGIIARREALRRLGLLGVSVSVAVPLLAACGTPEPAADSGASSPAPRPSPAGPPALPTEAITFAGPESRTLQAAWAAAADPRGAVLVVHENRGLTDHIRSVAGRLAASGFSALAVDLLSEEGGTARFTDPAQATAALNAAPPQRFLADLRAGVDELQRRDAAGKPGRGVGRVTSGSRPGSVPRRPARRSCRCGARGCRTRRPSI